jgi:hypothetical protein
MIIIDTFHWHLSEELKVKLERKNCVLVMIPDGMTSQLHRLGVSVNKPFKAYLRKEYEAWFIQKTFY